MCRCLFCRSCPSRCLRRESAPGLQTRRAPLILWGRPLNPSQSLYLQNICHFKFRPFSNGLGVIPSLQVGLYPNSTSIARLVSLEDSRRTGPISTNVWQDVQDLILGDINVLQGVRDTADAAQVACDIWAITGSLTLFVEAAQMQYNSRSLVVVRRCTGPLFDGDGPILTASKSPTLN
jgi:hypothetical protein